MSDPVARLSAALEGRYRIERELEHHRHVAIEMPRRKLGTTG
ncbi:MAG: hypothetical protein ACKVZ0_04300 [Gemmatimonadales bacterium]